jgi:hypothetical protein
VTGDSSGAVTAGRLRSHLETSYGIEVSGLAELDAGVFRVARADGPDWVARLFPAAPAGRGAAGDAAVLEYRAGHGYRAERLAADEPVSRLGDRSVLVTGYVPGVPRAKRAETIRRLGGFIRLGALLGRLHTLPVPPARAGPPTTWPRGDQPTRSPRRPGCWRMRQTASRRPNGRSSTTCVSRWRASTGETACLKRSSTPTSCSPT